MDTPTDTADTLEGTDFFESMRKLVHPADRAPTPTPEFRTKESLERKKRLQRDAGRTPAERARKKGPSKKVLAVRADQDRIDLFKAVAAHLRKSHTDAIELAIELL